MLVTSDDDGKTWSDLKLVIDPDGDGPVRAYDPCLWHDPAGRLWLFWAQGYEKHTDERNGVWAITTTDIGSGQILDWSEPARLCDGVMMNKPTVISSGEWLLPVARWHRAGSAGVYASSDAGATLDLRSASATIPNESDRSADEHMLVERLDGSLWMLVRALCMASESRYRWTEAAPGVTSTPLIEKHPATRFFVRRLQSGRLLLVKNGPLAGQGGDADHHDVSRGALASLGLPLGRRGQDLDRQPADRRTAGRQLPRWRPVSSTGRYVSSTTATGGARKRFSWPASPKRTPCAERASRTRPALRILVNKATGDNPLALA